MRDTLIIIPAHNEAARIRQVINKIKEQKIEADILVIDDGSEDNTAEIISQQGAGVISLPFNLGYGAALEAGYKYAYEKEYKYLVQMDADGQHEPKCLIDLMNAVKKNTADIIIGSRYLTNCGYKTPFARRLGTVFFSKIASIFLKKKITDPTSGFQAMNRKVLEFFVNGFYPSDYPDADVLILLNKSGFRVSEIPVIMYSNKNNKKSMHSGLFRPFYYIFKMNLSILMIFLRKN